MTATLTAIRGTGEEGIEDRIMTNEYNIGHSCLTDYSGTFLKEHSLY